MLTALRIAGPIVLGYLLGGIPFGVVIVRGVYHADITKFGSGNTGGTNVYRNFGWRAGLAVAVLDVVKAAIPTGLALLVADPSWSRDSVEWLAMAAGLSAAIGHSYSPYFRLRGGKAVSTAAGAIIVLMPLGAAVLMPVFALMIALTRIVSLASIISALVLPLLTITLYPGRLPLLVMSIAASGFVLWRHRSNIGRLVRGEEPRIGKGGLALGMNDEADGEDG